MVSSVFTQRTSILKFPRTFYFFESGGDGVSTKQRALRQAQTKAPSLPILCWQQLWSLNQSKNYSFELLANLDDL